MAARSQAGVVIRRLAPVALMPSAAFAVHQLRYWLAFGGRATAELQVQGHTYLHSLVPWIMAVIAVWAGAFLRALGRAFAGQRSVSRLTLSFTALWLLCAACLVGIYACQELLEGFFLTGHPGGLIGVFGYGGWWAVPASVAVGLVLAAVFHGSGWVLKVVARRYGPGPHADPRRTAPARIPVTLWLPVAAPLAGGSSGRGPPP